MYNCLKKMESIFVKQGVNVLTAEIDVENVFSVNLVKKLSFKMLSVSFQVSENGKTKCTFYTFQKYLIK